MIFKSPYSDVVIPDESVTDYVLTRAAHLMDKVASFQVQRVRWSPAAG